MPEPALFCKQSGKHYPFEVLKGFDRLVALQLHEEWETEKNSIIKQMLAAVPEAVNNDDLFKKQVFKYGLADMGWNWLTKAFHLNDDEHFWFFLRADEKIQAVCIIYHPKLSRIDDQQIFYIDYIASAYWNRRRPDYTKKFSNVGRELIAHASQFAIESLGYRPGFSLHSLPTAESYYRDLGMVEFDHDSAKENLRYYEAPTAVVEQLVREVSSG